MPIARRIVRISHAAAFLAAAFAARAAAAAPAVSADVSALLQRQTQEMMDATGAGDAAVWAKYLDDAATYVDENGAVSTKEQMVDGTRPLPAGVSGTIRVTQFHATVLGDVAVATHVDDEHENYHGHELHCQYRTTDTWRKTPAGWRLIAGQVLALKTDPPAVRIPAERRREYVGRYTLGSGVEYEIREKGDGLEGRQTGRPWEEIRGESPDVLFVPGKPRYRDIVQRGADGKITGFLERREAWDLDWARVK